MVTAWALFAAFASIFPFATVIAIPSNNLLAFNPADVGKTAYLSPFSATIRYFLPDVIEVTRTYPLPTIFPACEIATVLVSTAAPAFISLMVSVAVIACSVVFSLGVTVTTIPFTEVVNCSDLSVAASIVQSSALAAVTVTVLALSVAAKESDVGSSLVIFGSAGASPSFSTDTAIVLSILLWLVIPNV